VHLVLDTSVLVAAFRSRHGAKSRLLEPLRQGRLLALATPTLLFEYESVLSRPEHRRIHALSDEELDAAIRGIAAMIGPVRVDIQWKPQLTDPEDELVLEDALNGSAQAIVTHNVRHFQLAAERFQLQVATPGVVIKTRFS